jgi:hypothetical protein
MKINANLHTTNYFNTLIEVAEDTKATQGRQPPSNGEKKTVAALQYDLIAKHPYRYTSDEVIFQVYAERQDIPKAEYKQAWKQFFAKGQACLRTSPLAKTYGFGIHHNEVGKIALFGMETEAYQRLLDDPGIWKTKAMRSSRK